MLEEMLEDITNSVSSFSLIKGVKTMRQTILDAIIEAMKAKDKETLAVLRMVKGAMQLEEINTKKELDDVEMTQILSKQIKTDRKSVV